MSIAIIAAVDENDTYGINDDLPWRFHGKSIREDMKRFRARTEGNVVVMGKATFISLKKPLPKRENIVVSSTMMPGDGYTVVPSLYQAVDLFYGSDKNVFLIGGKRIWEEGIWSFAEEAFITEVKSRFPFDGERASQLSFHSLLKTNFEEASRERVLDEASGLMCEFVHYKRKP